MVRPTWHEKPGEDNPYLLTIYHEEDRPQRSLPEWRR